MTNPPDAVLAATRAAAPARKTGRIFVLPVVLFVLVAGVLGIGLSLDPRSIPSPLIGKPVPEFRLPPIMGRTLGLASTDLRGEVSVVNVFASWCVPCRAEHPLFVQLQRDGIAPLHGINYKDRPEDAARWLDELGDPYTRTGADLDGRVAIDWGVYGVPETYVIDHNGCIAFKHIGAVTPAVMEQTLRPLIVRLRQRAARAAANPGCAT